MVQEDNFSLSEPEKKRPFHESWTFIILLCIGFPLLFRSLAYAPFHIPSGSMKPTLLVGDFLFVSKSSYGYSKYSFPLSPDLFSGRLLGEKPKRGDIVVFRPPSDTKTDYIKRLIGLPGDTIQMVNGELYLNGEKVKRVEDGVFEDAGEEDSRPRTIKRYIETLPNGVSYHIIDDINGSSTDNTPLYKVPEGHYFMMGDNRDHSADSRTRVVSYVPEENLVGRGDIIFFSTSSHFWEVWKWPTHVRPERVFTVLPGGK